MVTLNYIFVATGDIPSEMQTADSNLIQDATGTRYRIYHHSTGYVGILTNLTNLPDDIQSCNKNVSCIKDMKISDIPDYCSV